MDGQRFDQLSRRLTATVSRRRALAGLLGLAAGAIGIDAASAIDPRRTFCRPLASACVRSNQCCSGHCDTRVIRHRTRANICACRPGETACRGTCKNLKNDPRNCGACGDVCPIGAICLSGECVCPGANQTVCDGACRDLGTTSDCLACDDTCPFGAACTDNGCECPWAESGVCSNVCTEFGTKTNCTDCGDVCATGASCTPIGCECDTAGEVDCDGICTPLGTTSDCLACGDACDAGATCYGSPTGCCEPSCAFKLANETDGCSGTFCPDPCLGVPTQISPTYTYVTASGKQVAANNTNVYLYNHPEGGNTDINELTSCTKDSDCTSCPTGLGVFGGGAPVDCGCDAFACQFPAYATKTTFQGYCTTYHNFQ